MDEFKIIKKYFQPLTKGKVRALNLNDDVFFDKKRNVVVSTDTYIQGKHFVNFNKPELVIKKVIRSSISDLVCKGVYPKYYFISASGNKKNFTKLKLEKIVKSLNEEQKKYKIYLSGGDTVYSSKLSFTITTIGFANEIIYRNKAKINDDIYVTGNIGDSYMGLLIIKKKFKFKSSINNFFINSYYKPDIKYSLIKTIKKFATASIDISDGLLSDLEKMTNNQNISYKIFLNKIPISKKLLNVLKLKKLLKKNYISNGDDYQILFSAPKSSRKLIKSLNKKYRESITRIGEIIKNKGFSSLVDKNNLNIKVKNKGYKHKF